MPKTILAYAKKHAESDEKIYEISPFCVMQVFPDGSALLYKNQIGRLEQIVLSRHDIEFIQNLRLPIRHGERPMFDKINDGKGNTFYPSRDQNMLAKNGWYIVERKKNGCTWIVKWADRATGEIWSQGAAVEIQRRRISKTK